MFVQIDMEPVRLAFPRQVFTLSQTEYVINRVNWVYDHREMVGGLRFVHEPATLRFFTGKLPLHPTGPKSRSPRIGLDPAMTSKDQEKYRPSDRSSRPLLRSSVSGAYMGLRG